MIDQSNKSRISSLTTTTVKLGVLIFLFLFVFSAVLDSLEAAETGPSVPPNVVSVTDFQDVIDTNPTDCICETGAGNGVCTLRAAIQTVNACPTKDTIELRAGVYSFSLAGANEDAAASGDLDIHTYGLTITGAGKDSTIISAAELDRVFHIQGSVTVAISGTTVRQGKADGVGSGGDGGGILLDQGASLTLSESRIEDNQARHWGGGIHIDDDAVLSLDKVTIQRNQANTLGGGIDNYYGTATVMRSSVVGNSVINGPGGGIYNGAGAVTSIISSTVDSNAANTDGGGIYNYAGSVSTSSYLSVHSSTISNNQATLNGGGIFNYGVMQELSNSTVSGNQANDDGGGIYNQKRIALINQSTVYGNSAGRQGGGIFNRIDSPLSVKNSILANNVQNNCKIVSQSDLLSLGFNIDSAFSCGLAANGDLPGTDPLLGVLADNGGETHSHMPAVVSPAIDKAGADNPLTTDQRGVVRPQGNGLDIGAVEREVANLAIQKDDSQDPVFASEVFTYTLTIENLGQSTAKGISVEDTLPSGTAYIGSAGQGWTCTYATGTIFCTKPQLIAGERSSIDIGVRSPIEGGVITNQASVVSTVMDTTPGNNVVSENTQITPVADLGLAGSDQPDPVNAGTPLQYSFTVKNDGPSTAHNVIVTDTLGAGVEYVSAEGAGWNCGFEDTSKIVSCIYPSLAVGSAPPVILNVFSPPAGGPLYNLGHVASSVLDRNQTNNSVDIWTAVVTRADISVDVVDLVDPVYAGMPLTYTLQVDNYGPSVAANVVVTSVLPAGTVFLGSESQAGWVCSYNSALHAVICSIPVLNTGGPSQLIRLRLTAPASPGTISSHVNITTSALDTALSNNTASEDTTILASADLEITAAHEPSKIFADHPLTYTLTVENAGPSAAQSVQITSTLPSDVVIQSVEGAGWVCEFNNTLHRVQCSMAEVAAGYLSTIVIRVVGPPDGGTTVYHAGIQSSSKDFDPSDNNAVDEVVVTAVADLSVWVEDNPDPADVNDLLVFKVSAQNAGPSLASKPTVTVTLPTSLVFQQAVGQGWTCLPQSNNNLVVCDRYELGVGVTEMFDLVVRTPSVGALLSTTLQISSPVVDLGTANNHWVEQTLVNPANLDLTVLETPNMALIRVNQPGVYILRVSNAGIGRAENTTITIPLPNSIRFDECSGGLSCTYDNQIITFLLPTLLPYEDASVEFKVTPTSNTYLTTEAWVRSPQIYETYIGDNRVDLILGYIQYAFPQISNGLVPDPDSGGN